MENKKFSFSDFKNGIGAIITNAFEYKKFFFIALGSSLIYAVISPVDTYFLGRFVDELSSSSVLTIGEHALPLYIVILVLWTIFQSLEIILNRFRVLYSLRLNESVRTSYIAKVSEHLFRLPLTFHKTTKMGEVQEKTTQAASAMGNILGDDVILFFPQLLSSLIILGIIYTLNHYLFLFVFVVILIYIYVTIITVRPTIPLQRESQKLYAKIRGTVVDAVMNVRIVKDFAMEKYQKSIILKGYKEIAMPVWYKIMILRRRQVLFQETTILISRVTVFVTSIYLVKNGTWSIGDVVVANMYLNQIFTPIKSISANWRNIQNGIIVIEETEKILNLPTEIYLEQKPNESRELSGKIQFKNISFGYSADTYILKDISFIVHPGDIIALVGESGVGKSSLIDLISGYHFAQQGDILIDDQSIKTIPLEKLRHNIGVVNQELTLFNDTIRNNIKYGNFEKTDEEVYEAAKKAHCFDFIEKFPEKWDQIVGERGLKLSVGQKQRIAIARAILKNPHILILDEPTSALDAGSEKIITESLDELMQGKTTFVVAHRLSTVRRAHNILVFKDGSIIESGTHEELLKHKNGEYKRLHDLQIGIHE